MENYRKILINMKKINFLKILKIIIIIIIYKI